MSGTVTIPAKSSASPFVEMDKADVIRRVAEALTEGDVGRAREIATTEYPFVAAVKSKRQYTPFQSLQVFYRDGFIDRYSADRLVNPAALHVLLKTLPLEFPAHPNWKMSETHIIYWELFPTIDHVVPVARGGVDDDSNWVTTSMVRNAAKSNWTLEELGWQLVDPGDPSTWDGLSRWFVDYVDAHQKLLADPYISKWSNATQRVIAARRRATRRLPAAPPRSHRPPGGATAQAGTGSGASLEERLRGAGPEVTAVAERLRVLAEEIGLSVVFAANSLRLGDRQGNVILLYPADRSVEFRLGFLWQAGRQAEADEIREALQRIAGASKQVGPKLANIGCREALAHWDEVTEIARRIVYIRADSGL